MSLSLPPLAVMSADMITRVWVGQVGNLGNSSSYEQMISDPEPLECERPLIVTLSSTSGLWAEHHRRTEMLLSALKPRISKIPMNESSKQESIVDQQVPSRRMCLWMNSLPSGKLR